MYLIRDFHCLNKLADARQQDLKENVSFYSKFCHVIICKLIADRNKTCVNLEQNAVSGGGVGFFFKAFQLSTNKFRNVITIIFQF